MFFKLKIYRNKLHLPCSQSLLSKTRHRIELCCLVLETSLLLLTLSLSEQKSFTRKSTAINENS